MEDQVDRAVVEEPQTPAPPPHPDPRGGRRLLVGWGTALAALALSTAAVALALWLVRAPVAKLVLSGALAERGLDADFQVAAFDLDHIAVRDLRVGAADAPDLFIRAAEARWRWRGLFPSLQTVRLVEPHLRLQLSRNGQVSSGALARVNNAPTGRRPRIPHFDLEIERARITMAGPFGELIADGEGDGVLGEGFTARARLRDADARAGGYRIARPRGELVVTSRADTIVFNLSVAAERITWEDTTVESAEMRGRAEAPLDLANAALRAGWRVAALRSPAADVANAEGLIDLAVQSQPDRIAPAHWRGRVGVIAGRVNFGGVSIAAPAMDASAEGDEASGHGRWSGAGARFNGAGFATAQPRASGTLGVDWRDGAALSSDAEITLADARLDSGAARVFSAMFPNIAGSPLAPTFAAARDSFEEAGRRFSLVAPISFRADRAGTQLVVRRSVAANAASGGQVRLSPLRVDAPALTLQWPEMALRGAVDIELAGGGLPSANMLFDTVRWTPSEPLDADGTLTLSQWRADDASIAADELDLSVSLTNFKSGHVELSGPARISGPVGDGEARDLVAGLDLAIGWGDGWRVSSGGRCMPMRIGALDAAGLSLSNGAFQLCPRTEAFIGADARGRLSGGFRVHALSLAGRLSGQGAQPAQLSAADLIGQFHGGAGDALLSVTANAPALRVTLASDRMLTLSGAQLTAEAHLSDAWRVEGAFRNGALNDPALPGVVSAIAGRWTATPENEQVVLRAFAGEALVDPRPPASDQERPLFHTLRLADFAATLRDGAVAAEGALVLAAPQTQLARFTAQHDIDSGEGGARFTAPDITFGPALQPYAITEMARGLVDNVRGHASAGADIAWSPEGVRGSGAIHLDGLSLATATIPTIHGVRGDVMFDDLFALTTPPGQEITLDSLDPGIAVHNGRIRFQLLPERRIAIEDAAFDFASGVLSVEPAVISVGADETRFVLALHQVEAASLIADLNLPDIQASGRLEGVFPLLLTRRTALIQNGVLRSRGGGTLSYVGHAGDNLTGAGRVAFQALQSFHFDELELTLNGDLSGEVVSAIEFSGHNAGEAVDLSPIAQTGLPGGVAVRGAPFAFHVRVTAPFRSLAETAASITDANVILRRAGEQANDARVDPAPQTPR